MSLDQDGLGEGKTKKGKSLSEPMKIDSARMAETVQLKMLDDRTREMISGYRDAGHADDKEFERNCESVIQDLDNKNYSSASEELNGIAIAIDEEFYKNVWDLASIDFYQLSAELKPFVDKEKQREFDEEYQAYYSDAKYERLDPVSYSNYVKQLEKEEKESEARVASKKAKGHEITYRTKKMTYYGGTKAEIKKVKNWKYVGKAYTLGEELALIDKFVTKGHIVKSKQIYKASMILINDD